MITDVLLWILAFLLVVVGLVGLALPAIPGAPVLFGGLFVAAWAEDFVYAGPWTLALLAVMAALTYAVDFAAGAVGARRFGASRRAVIGAVLGAIVGLFFGLPGVLLGPFLGAMLGELSHQRGLGAASRAGIGATLGLVVGVAAKLALGVSMLGLFVVVRFLGAGA